MNRRNFLTGGAAVMAMLPGVVHACTTNSACVPSMPPDYVGTGDGTPPLRPTLCLSDPIYRVMTENRDGVKVMEALWDYGLYYGRGHPPEVYPTLVEGQCYNGQYLWPGTSIINWVNCRDHETGEWTRYWSATRPIVDNGRYELVEYHREPATGYDDVPEVWPLPF